MRQQYQVKLTLEGTAKQIEHALLSLVRDLQDYNYNESNAFFPILRAEGYEDILIDSQLKEI